MLHSGLLVCSFFIKKRYGRSDAKAIELNKALEVERSNNIESYSSVWELFKHFLNENNNPKDDENSMKLFSIKPDSIKEHDTQQYHAITFIISSGSYGIESSITNRRTKEVKYHKTCDDADIKQFYGMFFIPKDIDDINIQKGIFIFQSIGTYGIKTITIKQMKEFFAMFNLTLETRSVSVGVFLKKILEEGKLSKITLIKNDISPDSADNMLISTGREEKVYVKPKLKESWIQKLSSYVDGNKDEKIFEVNDDVYEDIYISFNLSGRTKTAKLKDIDRFSLTEDIPDTIFNNGIVNDECLVNHLIETAKIYKEKMVFRITE